MKKLILYLILFVMIKISLGQKRKIFNLSEELKSFVLKVDSVHQEDLKPKIYYIDFNRSQTNEFDFEMKIKYIHHRSELSKIKRHNSYFPLEGRLILIDTSSIPKGVLAPATQIVNNDSIIELLNSRGQRILIRKRNYYFYLKVCGDNIERGIRCKSDRLVQEYNDNFLYQTIIW